MGYSYRREQKKVHAMIKKAGGSATITVISPSGKGAFSGAKTGSDREVTAYFCQQNQSNESLEQNPNQLTSVNLLVSPLDINGIVHADFISIVEDKAATVRYADGTAVSVENARITAPDGYTPILARLRLGG